MVNREINMALCYAEESDVHVYDIVESELLKWNLPARVHQNYRKTIQDLDAFYTNNT